MRASPAFWLLIVFLGTAAARAEEPALPGASVYHLGATWTSAEARPTALRDLRGKPVLLAMFFSHCEESCPLVVARMKTLESRLSEPDRVRFVLVSFDSARDDPARLRRFRERMGLDSGRWTLLRGNEGAVRELAAVLGIRYRQDEGGGFSHSNVIQLLDAEGRPAARLDGVEGDPAEILRLLETTLRGEAG